MTAARKPDWETALSDYLASVRDRPHAYGRHDCMLFVAGAVAALTGHDFAVGHRRKYKTGAGALRHLRQLGFRSAGAIIDTLLPEVPPAFAHRGDVVLADGIPGICMGDHALFVGERGEEEGLFRLPLGAWSKAWAVGREHVGG